MAITTTRSIVLAVVFAAAIVMLFAIGAGVIFFLRHHQSESASPETAAAEFEQLRARFADQQPLLDMDARQARASSGASRSAALHAFHAVIFDTRGDQRLVRITVPYRFVRLYARHNGSFQWLGELTFLDDTEFDPEPIHLSLEHIERHGPGLIVDYRHPGGGQFIAWAE